MAILAALLSLSRDRDSRVADTLVLVLAAALFTALAFSGHAAAGEGLWLIVQLTADALHLLAAGIWLGGLVAFAFFLLWIKGIDDAWAQVAFREATRRFSILGLISVVILAFTGSLNAWALVGAVPPLLGTSYGKLLLTKLLLLLPLVGVAAMNLLDLKPQVLALGIGNGLGKFVELLSRLRRNVVAEALLGACILLIVGIMSVTPPARHVQPEWPLGFRWNWSAASTSAKIRTQMAASKWLAAAALVAICCAALRRRQRYLALGAGLMTAAYAGWVAHNALSIDAYPATYTRPAVSYNVISVASGAHVYQQACSTCHGVGGYGDGVNGKGLKPRPANLTAKHTADHTAGDLFWWLSYGVKGGPMPGFAASLEEEERWDMINFLRALSYAEQARQMSTLVEPDPWLVAPDFIYRTNGTEGRSIKDHRGNSVVLLVLFDLPDSQSRLAALDQAYGELKNKGVEVLAVPKEVEEIQRLGPDIKSLPLVTDGSRETFDTYALFRRSFSERGTLPDPPIPSHMEFLIDRQGYVRARWIPQDGPGWDKMDNLLLQIDRLNKERASMPAPDEHVH